MLFDPEAFRHFGHRRIPDAQAQLNARDPGVLGDLFVLKRGQSIDHELGVGRGEHRLLDLRRRFLRWLQGRGRFQWPRILSTIDGAIVRQRGRKWVIGNAGEWLCGVEDFLFVAHALLSMSPSVRLGSLKPSSVNGESLLALSTLRELPAI
ncbi:hypothetical protein CWO91_19610 [Bradyrhizobium genosp. SA-3]|nr:hypothetical protein CWO91_19610 [Bradyrhizobium genosp. SA-3]